MNDLPTKSSIYRDRFRLSILTTASALSLGLGLPTTPVAAQEQEAGHGLEVEEIVVTARRREEELQDVPVSLTYFDQKQLDNLNMFQASDLAIFTPSLAVDNRFGSDSTNFVLRGFSQELRTTAAVGVYFAEVVAPRGANTTRSGDGAGPGDMFDLENIQVLKGPQGTLFGRNTTGGAVLLTPKRPTDEFEGYAEVSMGNYDMIRTQGVLNIPVSDNFRMRFGVDRQKRDGYLENFSGIGPSDMEDIDYVALRASFVWDITDTLENYTILKYNDSDNNGAPYSLFACNTKPGSAGSLWGTFFCAPDLNNRRATGHDDFYDVYNFVPDSRSKIKQAQVINTTTWEVNDQLTVKNILSYAEFESEQNFAIYGTDWRVPSRATGLPTMVAMVGSPDFKTTDQRSFVEELQFQGGAFDDRLDWQAGIYFERSTPMNEYGSFNPGFISCDVYTVSSPDINDWRCSNTLGIGSGYRSPGGVVYKNEAIYAEGNYHFTDQWTMTLGLRYTEDETKGETQKTFASFPAGVGWAAPTLVADLKPMYPKSKSDAATWNLGVQYKPTADLMLYGKYTRGYRQGSVNLDSIPEWAVHDPESVDTYEIGAKGNFGGPFPGTFGIAAFYNDFNDQQIQAGYLRTVAGEGLPVPPATIVTSTTSILNSERSTLQGIELDGTIMLTNNLNFSIAYAWIDTEVDQFTPPAVIPASVRGGSPSYTAVQGESLPGTPRNKLVATANYRIPVAASWGDITASVTYTFTDDTQWVARKFSPYAFTEAYSLVNFNVNWEKIAGTPVDVLLFVTNAFDKEHQTLVTGSFETLGMETGRTGIPRMYGARLRYSF